MKGEGFLLLAICGAMFFTPRIAVVRSGGNGNTSVTATTYHVLRFYGSAPSTPRSIIDIEIDRAADREGIPRSIFHALVHVESRKNPRAVSPVGARGLAQVMPANVKRCGLSSAQQLFDPIKNLACGAQILREDFNTYGGNMAHALASYNCGRITCKPGQLYARNVMQLASRMAG